MIQELRALAPLYTLIIALYGVAIRIASPWNGKARAFIRGRRHWQEDLQRALAQGEGEVVWFHCASLGEFEQGRPLMEAYKQRNPGCRLVISFFSPSGYEVRCHYPLAHYVCYLPLDGPRRAQKFVEILKPSVAFFVKYEVWYFYLNRLKRLGIPSYLISALFPEQHPVFQWWGGWYRGVYALFSHIFVQDPPSAVRLQAAGFNGVTVSGDTRFDRVLDACAHPEVLPWLESFRGAARLLVVGSSWPDDEQWLSTLWEVPGKLPDGWKMVIAPHEVAPRRIATLCDGIRVPYQRYSQIAQGEAVQSEAQVLVLDTVGKLLSVYAYASLAYVGGAYRTGLHNTLEPAAYGVGVVFGANYRKFLEAIGLLEANGAVSVARGEDLLSTLYAIMNDAERCQRLGQSAREYVRGHAGACERILGAVRQL